jgi:hypothetical protein
MAIESTPHGTVITGQCDTALYGLVALRVAVVRMGGTYSVIARRRFGLAPRANQATILAAIDKAIAANRAG